MLRQRRKRTQARHQKRATVSVKKKYLGHMAQISLEFLFSMIMVSIMIYSLVMVLRWSGMGLAERRLSHDNQLIANINPNYVNMEDGPLKQIDPYFHEPLKLKGTFSP